MCKRIDIQCDDPLFVKQPGADDTNGGIEHFEGDYNEFFTRYLLPNKPCIVKNATKNWKCSRLWVKDDTLNINHLREAYGDAEVTVANCDKKYFNVQVKTTVKFSEFTRYWQSLIESAYPQAEPCLYLKDWHFTKDFPDAEIYTVPPEFCNDWLNEYFAANKKLNDDYRFVYMGPKGSWTPFHVDVFTSYSWSVNIYGAKKWILLPPGEEEKLKDKFGSLPYDISFLENHNNNSGSDIRFFIVHQRTGDAIFVPSGWHHQVWNTVDTISINHNWVNACNIDKMLSSMFRNLEDVKKEIIEFRDTMDDWAEHCQLLLKSCFGMDFRDFNGFLTFIIDQRERALSANSSLKVYGDWLIGPNHQRYDLKKLQDVRTTFLAHSDARLTITGTKIVTLPWNMSDPGAILSIMDVDNPGTLKRSNSAPMIPQLNHALMPSNLVQFNARSASPNSHHFAPTDSRTRRFSASFSPRTLPSSPRTLARIEQIRLEECTDALDREVAHENKLHSAMRISQSWEDLTIMVDSPNKADEEQKKDAKGKDGGWDPLNLHLSNFSLTPSCSPSPTRNNNNFSRQCYSPSLFKVNLSPSPTRKTFATRRSLSPIAIRPSPLGSIKRKFDLSDSEPPAKRTGGLLLVQSTRSESSASPLAGSSVSSVGTPESISSLDSPNSFSFASPDSPSCDHPMRDVSKVDQKIT